MPPLFCLAILLYAPYVCGQYTVIWYDDMEQNNGWTPSGDVSFAYDSSSCTNGLCTRTTVRSDGIAWIRRSTDVSNYHSLRLKYSVGTKSLESHDSDECRVYYSYTSNTTASRTLIQSHAPPDFERHLYPNNEVILPDASSANTVHIWLETCCESTSSDYCYWDDVYLEGILSTKEPTVQPTKEPTHAPTTNNPTTPSPITSGPTALPTKAPTDDPTFSPITLDTTAYSSLIPLNQTPLSSNTNSGTTTDRVTTEYGSTNAMDAEQHMDLRYVLVAINIFAVVLILCICVLCATLCFYHRRQSVVQRVMKYLGIFEKHDAPAQHEISDSDSKKDSVKKEQYEAKENENNAGVTPEVTVFNGSNIISGSIKMASAQQTEGRQKGLSGNITEDKENDEPYIFCNECDVKVKQVFVGIEGNFICSACKDVEEMFDKNKNQETTSGATEH